MAKKKTKSKSNSSGTIPFEQSLDQLKQIVGELENGNLTLSDSLERYEQGVGHLNQCYLTLNEAQHKIELLVDLDEDGNLTTRPFDNTDSTQMTDGTRRSGRPTTPIEGTRDSTESDDLEDEDMDDSDRLF